jgi:hypothetical protein
MHTYQDEEEAGPEEEEDGTSETADEKRLRNLLEKKEVELHDTIRLPSHPH